MNFFPHTSHSCFFNLPPGSSSALHTSIGFFVHNCLCLRKRSSREKQRSHQSHLKTATKTRFSIIHTTVKFSRKIFLLIFQSLMIRRGIFLENVLSIEGVNPTPLLPQPKRDFVKICTPVTAGSTHYITSIDTRCPFSC